MGQSTNNFINRLKSDYTFRTFVTTLLSLIATLAFVAYNAYCGAAYKSSWNISIAIYYVLLVLIRACTMLAERKIYKSDKSDEQKEEERRKLFLAQSIMLLLIDAALLTPISIMVLRQKSVEFTMIPAIAVAAYTFYKVIMATYNFVKTRRMQNLSVTMLRNINFVDALVSVLTLQYMMIMTFNGANDSDMIYVCAVSSIVIWLFLVAISILSVIKAAKNKIN